MRIGSFSDQEYTPQIWELLLAVIGAITPQFIFLGLLLLMVKYRTSDAWFASTHVLRVFAGLHNDRPTSEN